jgi:hypothetical protein
MVLVVAMAIASCAHDSDSANPLDPDLTPPVELVTAIDDTTGTVTLTWTTYAGRAAFDQYWILRKAAGLEAVDTLAVLKDVALLSYADSSVSQGVSYSYRISVVNDGGLEMASASQEIRPLLLPCVQIESLTLDSSTATAHMTWRPYDGPRFAAYQLLRRAGGGDEMVAQIFDLETTDFTDRGLVGNVSYAYRVVVVTAAGEHIDSAPRSGIIHRLVDSWTLELDTDEVVRLSLETDGRIRALVAGKRSVRLLAFTRMGNSSTVGRSTKAPCCRISPTSPTCCLAL